MSIAHVDITLTIHFSYIEHPHTKLCQHYKRPLFLIPYHCQCFSLWRGKAISRLVDMLRSCAMEISRLFILILWNYVPLNVSVTPSVPLTALEVSRPGGTWRFNELAESYGILGRNNKCSLSFKDTPPVLEREKFWSKRSMRHRAVCDSDSAAVFLGEPLPLPQMRCAQLTAGWCMGIPLLPTWLKYS